MGVEPVDLDDDPSLGHEEVRPDPESVEYQRRLIIDRPDPEPVIEKARHQRFDDALGAAIAERPPIEVLAKRSRPTPSPTAELSEGHSQPLDRHQPLHQGPLGALRDLPWGQNRTRVEERPHRVRDRYVPAHRHVDGPQDVRPMDDHLARHRMARPRRRDLDRLVAVKQTPEPQRRSVRCNRA
ncbi:MAG TPA: hypothetical protein VJ804_13510 [Acidimicrobiales bacterium]|nr:hypothetical protein [Acidimicrobiales bacterium]